MPNAKRPLIVTLFALVNVLFGLLGLAGAALNGITIFGLLTPPPASASAPAEVPIKVTAKGRTIDAAMEVAPLEKPGELAKPKRPADPNDVIAVTKEKHKFLLNQMPAHEVYVIGALIAYAVLALMLLASGIGLFKLRPYGRNLVFLFFLLSVAVNVASSYYMYETVRPELENWEKGRNDFLARAFHETPPEPRVRLEVMGFVAAGGVLGIAYPLLQMMVMLLPSVRAAFQKHAEPGGTLASL